MTTATKPKGLHAKLAEVMAEAGRIPKNGSYKKPGEYGHFMFVQVGDAADAIRTALGTRGVSMLPEEVEVIGESEHETKSGGTMTTLSVRTTWVLTDSETGEKAAIQSIGTGADAGDKASPKAQTNAMKYALLMGFLLSTGDDPELSDSSDRQSRRHPGLVDGDPPERTEKTDGSLIGTVAKGKPPVDLELRETPEGPAAGFKLTQGRGGLQVLASGSLATTLQPLLADLEGKRVTVWGNVVMIPWSKDGKDMPPYRRLELDRIDAGDWTLPTLAEAETVPMFTEEEAAAIIEAEKAEAAAG